MTADTADVSAEELEARATEIVGAAQVEARRLQSEAAEVMAAAEGEARRLRSLAAAQRAEESRQREEALLAAEIEAAQAQAADLDEALQVARSAASRATSHHRDLRDRVGELAGPVTVEQHQLRRRLAEEAYRASRAEEAASDHLRQLERRRDALEAHLGELRAKLGTPAPAPVVTEPSPTRAMWSAGKDTGPSAGWFGGLLGRRIG